MPEYIREAGVRAIREGHTHYPPAAGLRALREAIAAHVTDAGGPCTAAEVLVSAGAKQALFEAFFVLFGPGDRVLVPAPFWVSYPAMARLARAEPVIVETRAEDGWKLTAGALELAAEVHGNDLQFFWRPAGADAWQAIGPVLDAGVVSDEGGRGEHGSFTGAFIGLFAFDITGRGRGGDFAGFRYTALS